MTIQDVLNCGNKQEVRRSIFAFAISVNYKVENLYLALNNEWFNLMSEIHANGKEGNYENAILIGEATDTLKTWTKK